MYLARFGYLDPAVQNPTSASLVSGETVTRAILDFQAFAGLNQTGNIPNGIVSASHLMKQVYGLPLVLTPCTRIQSSHDNRKL